MRLDALLRQTADGVCGVDQGGKISLWTPSAQKILGYSARDVMGRPCCEVFVEPEGSDSAVCYQGCHVPATVVPSEPVRHVAVATRTKVGKPIWLHISIISLPEARPDASTILHLFRDVTTAKEIEALVRESLVRVRPEPPVSSPGTTPTDLTRRELEILRLIVNGASTRSMAGRLHVSPITVRNHVQSILRKLNVHSRLEAVAYVIRHRII